jgi:hypothetical protein
MVFVIKTSNIHFGKNILCPLSIGEPGALFKAALLLPGYIERTAGAAWFV